MLLGASVKVIIDLTRNWAVSYQRLLKVVFGLLCVLLLSSELKRTFKYLDQLNRFPCQPEMLLASKNIVNHLARHERVGSFNAGIISYFSGLNVINLDGVVNEDAAGFIRARTLGTYLKTRDIEYIIDFPVFWNSVGVDGFAAFMGKDFELTTKETIAKFDIPGIGCPDSDSSVQLVHLEFGQ